jgi:ribonucleotide monophosphatase NagD (HAD superfamily)
MIGDNPLSDIAGGNAAGWTTILVKSGVFKADEKNANDKTHPATYVVDDLK